MRDPEIAAKLGIGAAALVIVLLAVWFWLHRDDCSDRALVLAAALLAVAIPFFLPHMHDRYFFAADALALALAAAAALGPRWADHAVSWLIDLMMGIPHIVLLILISYALGKGFWGVTIGVALTHWPSLARILRAEILQCASSDFVAAAARLGAGRLAISARHMVPYVLPQFVVGLVLLFPHAILHEAAITFLGFGLPPEMPAIGIILSEAMGYLSAGLWWLAVFPGLALVVCVMLFDVVGTSLRKLVDPAYAQE